MRPPRLIVLQPTPYCNINCSYCYLGHRDDRRLMSPEIVEAVRDRILARLPRDAAPTLVWHAGEPTAAPIAWYDRAYGRLREVAPPGTIFAMQSNGVAIDEAWVAFFRRTRTEVSLSIDGPERFHDARRRTRNGKPTWALAVRALERLQDAGMDPNVICVLHPTGLQHPREYYDFCREHDVMQISFSIDELEGANRTSSFTGGDFKPAMTDFLVALLARAYEDGFPLHIREIERIATVLAGRGTPDNEQIEPWDTIVVAADGSVSTFSPECMEVEAPRYRNFVFGNILDGTLDDFSARPELRRATADIAAGVAACERSCRYFAVCRGGAPVNKLTETGDLGATETVFCRLSVQAAADALIQFLGVKRSAPAAATTAGQPEAVLPQ